MVNLYMCLGTFLGGGGLGGPPHGSLNIFEPMAVRVKMDSDAPSTYPPVHLCIQLRRQRGGKGQGEGRDNERGGKMGGVRCHLF